MDQRSSTAAEAPKAYDHDYLALSLELSLFNRPALTVHPAGTTE